jgi:translation initiation factor IF-3
MRRTWQKAKPKEEIKFIANDWIRADELYLIDENGTPAGKVSLEEAKKRASDLDIDLVLVNPKAVPPIAKLVDLGQLKYEMEKKAHRQKVAQKKVDIKEIRLSVRIGEHDFNFRLNKAKEFLADGDKIRVDIVLKGRERQHPDKAEEVIFNFREKLKESEGLNVVEEQALTKQGGRFSIILMNKK